MAKEEIVRRAVEGVKRAKGYCDDVEFSPEDAARTELDFLAEVVEAAIEAGATTVNIPDTVGYAVPEPVRGRHSPPARSTSAASTTSVISVHCHNDLGLAVANSLAAVQGRRPPGRMHDQRPGRTGRQLRAGRGRHGRANTRPTTSACTRPINTKRLYPDQPAGGPRHRHPGAAQQGDRRPERLRPRGRHPPGRHAQGTARPTRSCGPRTSACRKTELVLGKHSGRHALRQRVSDLGYHLDDEQLQKVFEQFKALADRKKDIYDADIEALAEAQIHDGPAVCGRWKRSHQRRHRHHPDRRPCACGTRTAASCRDAAIGDGPVDARLQDHRAHHRH